MATTTITAATVSISRDNSNSIATRAVAEGPRAASPAPAARPCRGRSTTPKRRFPTQSRGGFCTTTLSIAHVDALVISREASRRRAGQGRVRGGVPGASCRHPAGRKERARARARAVRVRASCRSGRTTSNVATGDGCSSHPAKSMPGPVVRAAVMLRSASKEALAGAVGSVVSFSATYPLYVIVTQMQYADAARPMQRLAWRAQATRGAVRSRGRARFLPRARRRGVRKRDFRCHQFLRVGAV